MFKNNITLNLFDYKDIKSIKEKNKDYCNYIILNEQEKIRKYSKLKILITDEIVFNVYKDSLELIIVSFDGSSYSYFYYDKLHNNYNLSFNGKNDIKYIYDFFSPILYNKYVYSELSNLFFNLNMIDLSTNIKYINNESISLYASLHALKYDDIEFYIVDNNTFNILGTICIDKTKNNSYFGNVSYKIHDEYQNKGYATMALYLLKKLIYIAKIDNLEYLHISMFKDNLASEKVAKNNNGILIYEGKLNEENYIDNDKEIRMYEIKLSH